MMVIVLVAGLIGFQFKLPNTIRPHEDAIAAQAKVVCQKDRSNVIVPADWARFRLLSDVPFSLIEKIIPTNTETSFLGGRA